MAHARCFSLFTDAQPKAGTGHKMQFVPVVFNVTLWGIYRWLTFGSAHWLIEILSAILKSARQLLGERPLRYTSLWAIIGHFRITFSLFLKASLGAHPFIWKWISLTCKSNSFSYERMSTKTRFEEEAKGNSEMAYLRVNIWRDKFTSNYEWTFHREAYQE